MVEVGATQIGLIILFVVLLIAVVIYIAYNEVNWKLELNMLNICENPVSLPQLQLPEQLVVEYNEEWARALLVLCLQVTLASGCGLTYEVPPLYNVQVPLKGIDSTGGSERQFGTFYYSEEIKRCIIVMAGTVFPSEWWDDLDLKQVPPELLSGYKPGMLVHRGFYGIYLSIRNQLLDLMHQYISPGQSEVIITGHSLGGATATLAFFDLEPILNQSILYTFASPRVGNVPFAQSITIHPTVYRIFNTEDIITTLPLPILGTLIYEQAGSNHSFTSNLGRYNLNHTQAYLNYYYYPKQD